MTTYTTTQLACMIDVNHSNIKTALKIQIKSSWITADEFKYIESNGRRYYELTKSAALKLVVQLRPKIAYFMLTQSDDITLHNLQDIK
ncbi:hypothetical protein [Pseudoalteromonas sp. SCQQ13]|uniref:hypothetical protein n=1 Tax=Pseudoalteromonas sp. SCQQ13 TaxID=2792066 RepID=UPI0018CE4040|nr:hypothetical protein [Pseudoalteromonas sp. SCQQ13]MBH0093341.1 hypothetical protein [Pseudoalteromonas sp. SCQQ13]